MDNEVVIHVRADNDTRSGFAAVRADSNKTASDIEGEFLRAGKSISGGNHKITSEIEGEFSKVTKSMAKSGAKAGVDAAEEMGGSFGKTLSGMGPALMPVLGGMAIAAAPLIGATIAGAVIGGAGIGGVVGGVMLAARDPRIAFAG